MRKIYALFAMLLPLVAVSQQDVQFTQFMHNRLFYNPGVIGSEGAICITGMHRSQWAGFEGAPTTQNLNIDAPIKVLRGGLALTITSDQIGFFQNIGVGLGYAYQLQLSSGTLGFGIMAEFKNNSLNNALWLPPDPSTLGGTGFPDPNLTLESTSGFGVEGSFGVYYKATNLWLGLSTKQILESLTDFESQISSVSVLYRARRHYYLMGGYTWQIPSSNWALEPSLLVKSDLLASPSIDVNVAGVYNNKFWGGVTYRTEDAIGINIGYQFSESLRAGYSYDVPTSPLAGQGGGSHEIMLRYCFKIVIPPPTEGSHKNPRFL